MPERADTVEIESAGKACLAGPDAGPAQLAEHKAHVAGAEGHLRELIADCAVWLGASRIPLCRCEACHAVRGQSDGVGVERVLDPDHDVAMAGEILELR